MADTTGNIFEHSEVIGGIESPEVLVEVGEVFVYDNFLNFDINIIDNVSNNVEDSLFTAERDLVGTTNEINIIDTVDPFG